jgi:Fic family protein
VDSDLVKVMKRTTNRGDAMYLEPSTEAIERLDEKAQNVRAAMMNAPREQITAFWSQLDLSTIYHDWALEGQVVSQEELDLALDARAVTDVSCIPQNTAIRMHKKALEMSREIATRKNLIFTPDLFHEFHSFFTVAPENAKVGRYRKDIPLHRSYFHEICEPGKIDYNMQKLIDWMNNPEDAVSMHPVEWVTKFHFRFMHIFPFVDTTGKIGRTMANMILIRYGYLPAIIHATERQRYYEVIRQSQGDLGELLNESAISSLDAADKFLRSSAMAS